MIRLNMVVEGQTEETFVRDVLASHLALFGVFAVPRCVESGRKRRGRDVTVYRGGLTGYCRARRDLFNWLKQDRKPGVRFTTMLDLYGLPGDFPGYADAAKERDPLERVAVLERAFGEDVGDRRFLPFIQPHEFEALLFSDVGKFAVQFPGRADVIASLEGIAAEFSNPEHIDDEDPPAKRIARSIPEYRKPADGPLVAAAIGIERIRKACAHFNDWLTILEQLNRQPPGDDRP